MLLKSSMQQTPLDASPAYSAAHTGLQEPERLLPIATLHCLLQHCMLIPPFSGKTEEQQIYDVVPIPVVNTERGTIWVANLKNWLFPSPSAHCIGIYLSLCLLRATGGCPHAWRYRYCYGCQLLQSTTVRDII